MHGSFTHAGGGGGGGWGGGGYLQIDTNACDVNNIKKFNSKVDIQERVHSKGHKHSDLIVKSKFSHISVINHYRQ